MLEVLALVRTTRAQRFLLYSDCSGSSRIQVLASRLNGISRPGGEGRGLGLKLINIGG